LTYLGDAREEKGFDLLPELISRVEPLWRGGACRFVIQAHPGLRPDRTRFNATVAALRQFPAEAVEVVEEVLDEAGYRSRLGEAAAVLTPFDPAAYERRSSSIVTEALANAIPAVAPAATWMADVIGENCGVTYRSADQIPDALRSLVEDYRRLWEGARAMAPHRREAAAACEFARRLGLDERSVD
jgi:glycosyltransferase involved in cell wall biosynthesis